MFNRDRWNEILETLTSNWVRTVLTAFGVFWGIFILVILLGASNGFKNGIMGSFGGMASNTMFCWAQRSSMPYKGMKMNREYSFDIEDVEAIKKIPYIKIVSPRQRRNATISRGLESESYQVFGDYPELTEQESLKILQGRFINYSDINQQRKICVIGQDVAKDLFKKDEEIIGASVAVNGLTMTVVGVYKLTKANNSNDQKNIYIPFTSFQQVFNTGGRVAWMVITAEDNMPITDIKEDVLSLLRKRHYIHPEDKKAVGHFDLNKQFQKIKGLFNILTIAGYLVGFMVLASGVIGVSNIMLIVVKERTKEIGILRALGATPKAIRGQIFIESVFLTLISGLAGVCFSAFVFYLVNAMLDGMGSDSDIMFANPSVGVLTIVIALTILIGSGMLAGLIPAQTAIRVKPIDALRVE